MQINHHEKGATFSTHYHLAPNIDIIDSFIVLGIFQKLSIRRLDINWYQFV